MPLLLRVKGISEELSMDEIYTVLLNELKHRGIPVGLSKTKVVKKIRTDILGNCYECEKEKFSFICK